MAWQLGGRGVELVSRLATNVVLARLLCPDDFGLMGIVVSTLAAVDAITSLATDQAILCDRFGGSRSYQHTVFVFAAARGLALGVIVAIVAPLLGLFYGRPDAVSLLMVAALQPVLAGLANPGAVALLRTLRFRRWTLYRLSSALVGVLGTVGLALALRSVWALLLGQMLAVAATTAGSYLVVSSRPRLRVHRRHLRALRRFGLAAAGTPVLLMLIAQAPVFLLGRYATVAVLGAFMLNARLVELPLRFGLQAVSSVLVPHFASMRSSRSRLHMAWIDALRRTCLVATIAGCLVGWLGADLVLLLFGDAYAAQRGTIEMLAIATTILAPLTVVGALLWGLGKPAADRRLQVVRVIVVYAAGVPLVIADGGRGLAIALAGGATVALLVGFAQVRDLVGGWRPIALALRPAILAASGLSAIAVADAVLGLGMGERLLVGVSVLVVVAGAAVVRWRRYGFVLPLRRPATKELLT